MKRLLIVAPAFPPHPSPATHRARFLARWARDFGWEPEIVTVNPKYYAEPWDEALWALVPQSVRVTYAPALPVGITRPLGVGDLGMRSYYSLRATVRTICRQRRPDMLFFTAPPFHTFLIGTALQREQGIPYVLDYSDPWLDPMRPEFAQPWRKVYWVRRLGAALEPRAALGASHIFGTSTATHDSLRQRVPQLPDDRFSAEPFGFEPDDFEAVRADTQARDGLWPVGDGKWHLVYAGAVSVSMIPAVRALFGALTLLRVESPSVYERLRLHFVGTSYDPNVVEGPVMAVARECGVSDVVEERPRRVGYVDALRLLTAADAILALGSTDRHYQASKLFNCILARRPLLAIQHGASAACELIERAQAGELVTFGSQGPNDDTARRTAVAISRLMSGVGYDPEAVQLDEIAPYTARAMTERMLGVCDRILEDAEIGAAASHEPEELLRA